MNRILRHLVLYLGALLFVFPFYYMVISSLQKEPDTTLRGLFPTSGYTLDNYTSIAGQSACVPEVILCAIGRRSIFGMNLSNFSSSV